MTLNTKKSSLCALVTLAFLFVTYSNAYPKCTIEVNCSNIDFIWIGEMEDIFTENPKKDGKIYIVAVETKHDKLDIPRVADGCTEEKMHFTSNGHIIHEQRTAIRSTGGFNFARPTAQEAFAAAKMICAPKVHPVVRR